jgi:hypothetical protein
MAIAPACAFYIDRPDEDKLRRWRNALPMGLDTVALRHQPPKPLETQDFFLPKPLIRARRLKNRAINTVAWHSETTAKQETPEEIHGRK